MVYYVWIVLVLSHSFGRFVIQNLAIELLILLKVLAQTIDNFSKVWQNKKNNLIYAKMIKVV
jgi:hypothetical protein